MRRDEFPIVEEYCRDKVVEELEKIKAEMLLKKRKSLDLFQNAFEWNIGLINKHISELQVENK